MTPKITLFPACSDTPCERYYGMENVDMYELEEATKIAAFVVQKYGDKYWPLFERLERELEARRTRLVKLSIFLP